MDEKDPGLQAVKARFDALAHRYDQTVETAKCFASDFILSAFQRHYAEQPPGGLDVLDLGCGTGLCGKAFRPYARRLDGVDLSDKMLEQARALGIYDHLHESDVPTYLQQNKQRYHLITLASVFLYFERLEAAIRGSHSALYPGGMLVFTVDRHPEPGPDAAPSSRGPLMYTHSRGYVRRCLAEAGFRVLALDEIDERLAWKDLTPVPALLVVSTRDS